MSKQIVSTSCNKGRGKMCTNIVVKYANCRGGQPANSNRCTSRHKSEADAHRKKKLDKNKAKTGETRESNKRFMIKLTLAQIWKWTWNPKVRREMEKKKVLIMMKLLKRHTTPKNFNISSTTKLWKRYKCKIFALEAELALEPLVVCIPKLFLGN